MAALRWAGAIIPVIVAAPAHAGEVERWHSHIAEASSRFGIPSSWIEQVMRAESRGRTQLGGRPIRSPKGAMGLMQLMPGTWAEMRERLGLGLDPDDPRDNIVAGTFYLRLLYDRFGYPGLFAAYNAGPARYEKYLAGGSLPAETIAYLAGISGSSDAGGGPEIAALFVGRARHSSDAGPAGKPSGAVSEIDPLFAVRHDAH